MVVIVLLALLQLLDDIAGNAFRFCL